MKDSFSQIRFFHGILILTAVFLLAFSLTEDKKRAYEQARDDLRKWQSIDPQRSFPAFVNDKVNALTTEQASLAIQKLKSNEITIPNDISIPVTGSSISPYDGVLLRSPPGWGTMSDLRYVIGNRQESDVRYFSPDLNALATLLDSRLSPTEIRASMEAFFAHAIENGKYTNELPLSSELQLTLLRWTREIRTADSQNLSSFLYPGVTVHYYVELIHPNWPPFVHYIGPVNGTIIDIPELKFRNWLAERDEQSTLVRLEGKEARAFPRLTPVWGLIHNQMLDNAINIVENKVLLIEDRSFELAGVSVPLQLVLYAGPIVCVAMQLCILTYVQSISLLLTHKSAQDNLHPWMPLLPSRIGFVLGCLSIAILPTTSIGLLTFQDWTVSSTLQLLWILLICIVSLATGILPTIIIFRLRAKIANKGK